MNVLSHAWLRLATATLPFLFSYGMALAQGTVRVAHGFAPGSVHEKAARTLATEIERASGGRIKADVVASLVGPSVRDAQPQLREGTIGVAIVPIGFLAQSTPELRVFELPFAFHDLKQLRRFESSEEGRKLLQAAGQQGVEALAFWNGAPHVLASRRPIAAPRDLRGTKLAQLDPKTHYAAGFQRLGAAPMQLKAAEVYSALSTGVVEAMDLTTQQLETWKLYDAVKNVTVTNHAFGGYVVLASPKLMRMPEVRKVLETAVVRVTSELDALIASQAETTLEALRRRDVKVTYLSPEQRDSWRKEMEPTWRDFGDTEGKRRLVLAATLPPAAGNGLPHPPLYPSPPPPPPPFVPALPAPPSSAKGPGYPAGSAKPSYPADAPKSTYPGSSAKPTYPADAPKPTYPADSAKPAYPADPAKPPTALPPPMATGPSPPLGPQFFAFKPTWNSWFNEEGSPADATPINEKLKRGTPYVLQFALSMTDLAAMLPGTASAGASSDLVKSLDDVPNKAVFKIAVLPADERTVHVADQYRSVDLPVDASKYRSWRDTRSNGWRPPSPVSPGQLMAEAIVGQVQIPFDIVEPGRHEIGLVVISPEGVTVDAITTLVCTDSPCAQSVSQAVLPPKEAIASDFTLWLHETTTENRFHVKRENVYAVLSARDPASGQVQLLSWNLWTNVKSLVTAYGSVQDVIADDKNSGAIHDQGVDFGKWIFHPRSPPPGVDDTRGQQAAAQARKWLAAAIPRDGKAPAYMKVRLTSAKRAAEGDWSFNVLPFSLMAFLPDGRKEPVFLGKSFIVSYGMPLQFWTPATECPQEWRISYPLALSTSDKDALYVAAAKARTELSSWPVSQQVVGEPEDLSGDNGFSKWLRTSVGEKETRTTVFGFLGHHDANTLFFNKDKGSFSVAQLHRTFKRPSVAILDACDVAMQDVTAGSFIGRLMDSGMGTVVTTVSKISGPLAAAYLVCMRQVLKSKTTLTVGETHYYVTQCMWGDDTADDWSTDYRFAHSALRYQVFGNPYVKLCYPSQPSSARPNQ